MDTEKKVLYVRIDADLHRRLRVAAAERDQRMSEFIGAALERHVETKEGANG